MIEQKIPSRHPKDGKWGHPKRKFHLPTIHFQVQVVLLVGGSNPYETYSNFFWVTTTFLDVQEVSTWFVNGLQPQYTPFRSSFVSGSMVPTAKKMVHPATQKNPQHFRPRLFPSHVAQWFAPRCLFRAKLCPAMWAARCVGRKFYEKNGWYI